MAEERSGEFKTNANGEVRVKKEEDDDYSLAGHSHQFSVKFSINDLKEHSISCNQPRTVLDVLKSKRKYSELNWEDENVIIQLGKGDKEFIVATHFPCSCVKDGETLIISCEPLEVEESKGHNYDIIHPRHRYSVFYIDQEGGLNTKTKPIFKSNAVKKYKYLCVYGEKGMTVKEALKRDGRFIDHKDFHLTDNDNPNTITEHTERVDTLDQKKFKLCIPRNSNKSNQLKRESVETPMEKRGSDNTDKIYKLLREQCPGLKEWMENRFPGNSYQEEVKLRKENFGKIQQSFSEVHRVRKLLQLGESVCKVIVEDVCQGTGFVLFENFILTNAHLFKGYVEGEKLQEDIDVVARFDSDEQEEDTNFTSFSAEKTFVDFDMELDYAILKLNPQGQKKDPKTEAPKIPVPPGLLKKFGPMPLNGEACLIGHPKGEVKKMDPTCIIEKEKREQTVNEDVDQYKDTLFIIHSVSRVIKDRGIEDIMMGGKNADKVGTNSTYLYHGSSGSPVFDADCRVFGLHTGGFTYGFPTEGEESVIEFALPLLYIFEKFVSNMKKTANEELLQKVRKEAEGNPHLKKVLGDNEPVEVDGE